MSVAPPADRGREGKFTSDAFVRSSHNDNVRIYFSTRHALECIMNFKTWHRRDATTPVFNLCALLRTWFTR